MTWWQIALLGFIGGGALVLVVSSIRRWRSNRSLLNFQEPFDARYGATMAGGWMGSIEDNAQLVAEQVVDRVDDPFGRR